MRATMRLLATPTAAGSTVGLKAAPMALLPPIPLYRRLFRTHRKFLPREMRLLGDEYIKSEFRAHRDVENPVHIVSGFLSPLVSSSRILTMISLDRFLDGVADVRTKTRRGFVARRKARRQQDR